MNLRSLCAELQYVAFCILLLLFKFSATGLLHSRREYQSLITKASQANISHKTLFLKSFSLSSSHSSCLVNSIPLPREK